MPLPGLSYRDRLPLTWQTVATDGPPVDWAAQNLRMLTALATLDERTRIEPETPGAQEFERLHHKFDLMIELLGALLRAAQPLPAPRPVCVGAEGLAWPLDADSPAPGACVDVRLYLHPSLPAPLQWRGRVLAHEDGEVLLQFAPWPEALAAAVERHVFTRHRRSVAGARSPVQRGDGETGS
ncbi:PilZ domain-containing protein [Solimonas variicoloris]|uniref:PilZ domain-containing protein n=1 Tax=Solimonas variicoloris TaxID=254408 RepID=UPI0003A98757|nr:PilZ domain-containing protein [Solimonas variicoloris]